MIVSTGHPALVPPAVHQDLGRWGSVEPGATDEWRRRILARRTLALQAIVYERVEEGQLLSNIAKQTADQ